MNCPIGNWPQKSRFPGYFFFVSHHLALEGKEGPNSLSTEVHRFIHQTESSWHEKTEKDGLNDIWHHLLDKITLFLSFSGTILTILTFSQIKAFHISRLISGVTLSQNNLSMSIFGRKNNEKYHYQNSLWFCSAVKRRRARRKTTFSTTKPSLEMRKLCKIESGAARWAIFCCGTLGVKEISVNTPPRAKREAQGIFVNQLPRAKREA